MSSRRPNSTQRVTLCYAMSTNQTTAETLRALEEAVRAPGPQLEEADAAVQGHIKGELRGACVRLNVLYV